MNSACTCSKETIAASGHDHLCPKYDSIDNVSKLVPDPNTFVDGKRIAQVQTFSITAGDPCFSPDKIVVINGFRFVSLRHIDDIFEDIAPELFDQPQSTRRDFWSKWWSNRYGT